MPRIKARRHLWPAFGLGLLVLFVYGRVHGFDLLIWDDSTHLTYNPLLSLPITWDKVATLWREPYFDLYIPVTYSAWAALLALQAQVDPAALHLLNLGTHLVNVALVYALLTQIFRSPRASALGAATFALHPLQVETVAWISCFRDLLSTCLALAAIAAAWRGLEGRRLGKWGLLASAAYGLAILAKPSAVTALGVLALLAAWHSRASLRRLAPLLAAWSVPALALTILQSRLQPTLYIPTALAPWLRPLIALDSLAFYLGKLLWPDPLLADYGRTPRAIFQAGWGYWTWAFPVAIAAILTATKRLRSPFALGLGVFAVASSATLGLISFGFQEFSTVADRYAYFGLFGIAICVAALAQSEKRGITPILAGVALTWAILSAVQLPTWTNTRTLFTHVLEHQPGSALAYGSLGTLDAQEDRIPQAIANLQRAVELRTTYARGFLNLGLAYLKAGRDDDALAAFAESVRIDPHDAGAQNNLGTQLQKKGRLEEAIQAYQAAMREDPHYALAPYNLGAAFEELRRWDEAVRAYEEALRRKPDFAPAQARIGMLRTR